MRPGGGGAATKQSQEARTSGKLEIRNWTCHINQMDQNPVSAPLGWAEALAESEAELARGERVSSQSVHDALRAALAEMEGGSPEDDAAPVLSCTAR
jgi:hypothetical protein